MTLLYKARNAMAYSRKIPTLAKMIWAELAALDTRIDDVEAGTVAEGSIATAELADDAVTGAKIAIFQSDEQTGTGEAQNVAHGLGVSPSIVFIELTTVGADGAAVSYTKGTTNVVVTATSGAKYVVHAIA